MIRLIKNNVLLGGGGGGGVTDCSLSILSWYSLLCNVLYIRRKAYWCSPTGRGKGVIVKVMSIITVLLNSLM